MSTNHIVLDEIIKENIEIYAQVCHRQCSGPLLTIHLDVLVCQWKCDTFTKLKSGIIMIIFFYYKTNTRTTMTKGKFPSAIETIHLQQWIEIHKDAVLWSHMNLIVAYDINQYILLSDNDYYIYRMLPYIHQSDLKQTQCVYLKKFKYMCNQLIISKGAHCVLRAY